MTLLIGINMVMMDCMDNEKTCKSYLEAQLAQTIGDQDPRLVFIGHKNKLLIKDTDIFFTIARINGIEDINSRGRSLDYIINVPQGELSNHWTVELHEDNYDPFLNKYTRDFKLLIK